MARLGRRLGGGALAIASLIVVGCSGGSGGESSPSPRAASTASTAAASTPSVVVPAPTPTPTPPTPSTTQAPSPTHPRPSSRPASSTPAPRPSAPSHAAALPLSFPTAGATQVITVVAPSTSSTQGTLQTWRKVAGGWRRVGPAVDAWLGSNGLSRHTRESLSATPIGSFTLTQAFGHDANPGTALPYLRTTPADWWISEAGPLYNTHQRCSADCRFTRGDPNEHLYYEMPFYAYAVVIDYNTRNAPGGVRPGAGSAFFLHVTIGEPTAGCVAIARDQLVRIMQWLKPGHAPRILIGVG